MPAKSDLNLAGLDITDEQLDLLLTVDPEAVKAEIPQVEQYLAQFGDHLPAQVTAQLEQLKSRLG